jgi:hypothetical protein
MTTRIPDIFSNKQQKSKQDNEALQDELYRQIGQLKVELDLSRAVVNESVKYPFILSRQNLLIGEY